MKILLVRPPVAKYSIGLKHIMICEPLELEYIGALLSDHEVRICDLLVENNFVKTVRTFKPDIIASSTYKAGTNELIKLFRKAKNIDSKIITIVGGVHATLVPKDFADVSVDIIGIGDGTLLMKEIVEALAHKKSLWDIKGLAIPIQENELIFTPERSYMSSADDLPLPDRSLVKHLAHKYHYLMHKPIVTMKTTWGCWYKCNFCFTWKITDGTPYSRSPENIVEELLSIDAKAIYIVDDIFLINRIRLRKLADLIQKNKIEKHYYVYGRADFIAENEDVIKEWAALGLKSVFIGIEAVLNEELEAMDKNTDVEHNIKAIEILRKYNVDPYVSLIPGAEYVEKDWERLWRFIEENQLYFVNISPMTPLPGASNYEEQKHLLTVPENAHALFDLSHIVLPTSLSLKSYYKQLLKLYSKTILNIERAQKVTQKNAYKVYSWDYLKTIYGTLKIGWQFLNAHKHHSKKGIALALDKGKLPNHITFNDKFKHPSFNK